MPIQVGPLERLLFQDFLYSLNLRNKGISKEMLESYFSRDLLTQNRIREIQNERLREFLKYCDVNSSYYRYRFQTHALNLNADDMFTELRKVPAIGKEEIRQNLESITSREYADRKGLIAKFTGGSTGAPLEIWGDRDDYRENNVIIARQRRWVNWFGGMRTLTLFGGFVDAHSRLVRTMKRVLVNDRIINIMDRSNTDFSLVVDTARKSRPRALIAYFSILKELAYVCELENRPLTGIEVIIACAEPLEERPRKHAEKWLGAPIYFQYGSRETGTAAQECRMQNGYHYAQDIALFEVIDENGNPCEFGNLTITWFANRVVPLVRYKIGDSASILTEPCACGLPYHRIDRIEGRLSAMIITPDDRRITSMIFPHLLKDFDWILEYQAEQVAKDRIIVRLRTNRDGGLSKDLDAVRKEFSKLLGEDIRFEFRINEAFLNVPTGKHVYFISSLPQG